MRTPKCRSRSESGRCAGRARSAREDLFDAAYGLQHVGAPAPLAGGALGHADPRGVQGVEQHLAAAARQGEGQDVGRESLTVPSWLIFFFPTVHFLQCFKRLTSMAVLMPVILSPNPCHKGVSRNFKDFAIQEVKTKCFYLQAFLLG